MTYIDKYDKALSSLPPSGGGGCHTALLGAATIGILAGLSDEQIFDDLRKEISGTRDVPDREIKEAIERANQDTTPVGKGGRKRKPHRNKPRPKVTPEYKQVLIRNGQEIDETALWNLSPVKPAKTATAGLLLLDTLYRPSDILFLGERYSTEVKTAADWIDYIGKHGSAKLPHIIPNPMTGKLHKTKTGKSSYRCDAAIRDYRFAMAEFDDMTREDQLAFWAAIPLPIVALIDSGGKSIHGWIKTPVGIDSAEKWREQVRNALYNELLIPLGVDAACRNESRLSRFPGHSREEKDAFQRLLYLNPNPDSRPIMEAAR